MSDNNRIDELFKILPQSIQSIILKGNINFDLLMEIRVRVDKPVIFIYNNTEYFISENFGMTEKKEEGYISNKDDVREILEYISCYSLYAFEDEIRQGFITINGGHRIGVTGKTVISEKHVKTMKNISCINIRISHQIKGCANKVIEYLYNEEKTEIMHTLIISPPRCGKTTLLRDIIRQVSDGNDFFKGCTVGVVDERSEIGACYLGVPQNDLGIRTDILDCCPKSEGMMMLIRAMSPRIIAVDEIGTREDLDAMEYVINCGCRLLATVHGNSITDLLEKPVLGKLVRKRVFDRYVILNNKKEVGNVEEIFDSRGSILYRKEYA